MIHRGDYGYRGPSGAEFADKPLYRHQPPMLILALQVLPHVRSLQSLANHMRAHGCTKAQWDNLMERLRVRQHEDGLSWISQRTFQRTSNLP